MLNYLKAFVVEILYDFNFSFSHGKLLCYALTSRKLYKVSTLQCTHHTFNECLI